VGVGVAFYVVGLVAVFVLETFCSRHLVL